MRKTLLATLTAVMLAWLHATAIAAPRKVQGQDWAPRSSDARVMAASDWEWSIPDDMSAPDGEFTFDMIQSWAGEGDSCAALVIQWYDSKRCPNALVFGYRWDGLATGADMIRAVTAANPRLYALIQYTNVGSPVDTLGGYTINGFGWDLDNDGDIGLLDTGHNDTYTAADGVFIHPRGYDPDKGGSPDYDYDDWYAVDGDDLWDAGWYTRGYWNYWVKDSYDSLFSYSGWGASARVLTDGSWDGWIFTSPFSEGAVAPPFRVFVPAPALIPEGAKTEFVYGGVCYQLTDYSKKTVKVVAPFEGEAAYEGAVTIPSTFVDGEFTYTVTEIGDYAFSGSHVESIDLPMTVKKIGSHAFFHSALGEFTVGGAENYDNITSIGVAAFGDNGLTKPVFSRNVKAVPDSCFYATAIVTLDIPDHVESLGVSSFDNCVALTTVNIPASVKSIGSRAFHACEELAEVTCGSTVPQAIDGETFEYAGQSRLVVPEGYADVYKASPGWCDFGTYGVQLIPVNDGDVFKVGGMTYQVTSVSGGTVKATYCKVEGKPTAALIKAANQAGYSGDITIPASVTYMQRNFAVTELNDSAFYEANAVTSVTIGAQVPRIGRYTFYDCTKLTSVTLPASLTAVDTYAFAYAGITSMQLPESVATLGERTFFQCKSLTSVNVPAAVTAIPNYCFSYCQALKQMELGDGITSLGGNVFQQCIALESVKLPSGLTAIPSALFSNCTSLRSVEIPAGVTEIKSQAFSGCASLDLKLPEGITAIGTEAFKGCKKLTEFNLPATITSVPNSVFYDCTALTRVTMSDKVTAIGTSSFRNCSALKSIELPLALKTIGSYGFAGCVLLDTVVVPEGVTSIGTYAFDGCKALKSVQLPSTLKTLSGWSFRNTALTELVVPASVTSMTGSDVVGNCTGVTVYSCNTTPGTCGTYTWRISGTTFAPIVVPTGTEAAYTAKNYWKKSALSSPQVTGVKTDVTRIANDFGRIALSGKAAIAYDMANLPARFLEANNALLLTGAKAALTYGDTTVDADWNPADSTFSLIMERPEGVDKIDATFTVTAANGTMWTSEPVALTLPASPSPVNSYVDFSKLGYTVGSGPLTGAVMISWNDEECGVDHLVWGVRFSDGESAEDIIAKVVAADSRLYALEQGGYAYDNMDKGSINADYDHSAANTDAAAWHVTADASPANGSVIMLTYGAAAEEGVPAAPDYTFCIPSEELLGAWVPEGYKCPIADHMVFPVWCRAGAYGYDYCSVTLKPSRPFIEKSDKEALRKGYSMLTLTLSPMELNQGPDKETYNWEPECYDLTVLASVWPKQNTVEGDDTYRLTLPGTATPMSIVEPVRPVTAINDHMVYVAGTMPSTPLTELIDFEPKDATYTGFILVDEATGNRIDTYMGRTVEPYGELPAGYEAWLNALSVGAGASDAIFSVRPRFGGENVEGLLGFTVNPYPVTDVYLDGVDSDETITMEVHEILALSPAVKPDNATNPAVVMTIENATTDNQAVTYPVGGSRKFTELVTYLPGEFDLVLTSAENDRITRTYHVVVNPLEHADVDYTDGTFWLNEEWFTHKNGSVNYLTSPMPESDEEIIYRAYARENDDLGFGATSQYAMIFADKLFVMSKQHVDAGDLRGVAGGRLVIADAKTLKRLASFDEIGGDGRACVGVSSEKVYVGTNAGIRVLHMDADGTFTLNPENLPGINNDVEGGSTDIGSNQSLYNKQIGDMVCAGGYVFAIQQGVGVHIIDAATDRVVSRIDDSAVQGIVQASDGMVWYASLSALPAAGTTNLHEIDPATLQELRTVNVPGTIGCGWGAWRSTNFFASKSEPLLFWNGAASSVEASGNTFFRWNTADDAAGITPLMTMPKLPGVTADATQVPYATMRYDDRTGHILMATTTAPSGNYRYNWYNFIDAATGEITRSIRLKDYYWFPALPVFPDKYAPEFAEIAPLTLTVTDGVPAETVIDLTDMVTDRDNIGYNVRLSLDVADGLADVADVTLHGRTLTLRPVKAGSGSLTLSAESNGVTSAVSVPVTVDEVSAIGANISRGGRISVAGRRVRVCDMDGCEFVVFDTAGRAVTGFRAESDDSSVLLTIPSGAYVLSATDGSRTLKFVIK